MAPIKIWELCAADRQRVWSPFCWAARLAVIHKGLDYETVPWKFTEKEKLQAASGQGLVPIIEDNGKVVNDSFAIAQYLERTYPDRPTLFGGPGGEAASLFVKNWMMLTAVKPMLQPLMAVDIHSLLADDDKAYFREQREKRFGKKLEEVCPEGERPAKLAAFKAALEPLRATLDAQPFLGGEKPLYTDIIVFSFFMTTRSVSATKLLDADDPVHAWRERMLDAYGGRKAVGYPV
ncbi:hypothetical protein WJX81_005481 [Elliptochloris bilobata]|uniref:GST N-terminal domain-containing protein n=1 Tax=Elliptochloris bilobata TaxID=381761 RepID=A0AAW1QVE3_9CHLO